MEKTTSAEKQVTLVLGRIRYIAPTPPPARNLEPQALTPVLNPTSSLSLILPWPLWSDDVHQEAQLRSASTWSTGANEDTKDNE